MNGGDDLRVPLRPERVLRIIEGALDRPARRVFGMKVANQYVGLVRGRQFEVWERRRHAVHLLGEVTREREGSRVALRTGLTLRARILIGLFFALFAIQVAGVATLPAERAFPAGTPFVMVACGIAAAGVFAYAARWQGADLRRFVAKALEELPPG